MDGKSRAVYRKKGIPLFSPVFLIDNPKDRKIVKLYNIALTNQPAMIDMDALVAKKGEKPVFEKIRKILGLDDSVTDEQMIAIVLKLVTQYQGFITKARESMDMDSWTSEEEVIVKVLTNLTENMVIASKSVLEALGVSDDAGESEVVATIHALKQGHADESEIVAMRTELAGLRKYKSEKERDLLVAEAFRREKIVFGQKAWAQNYAETDPDGFRLFIKKAPKVIDTGEIETAGKADRTDEDQLRINKMMGIDEETWKKYKPDEA
ncbi:MAG: hypothetical protein GY749_14530 [Desulfobacteraceae bacterium]|nr:hypothetical protein [Desulfobacteraceae bacterium]